jgi:NAD(P)-dependent dehydrogenase (short-subunit alcohol dehydrogenase family)
LTDFGCQDKSVYITGGAQGIGFAVAQGFLAAGARVAISDVETHTLEAARASLGPDLHIVAADLTSADDVRRANEDVAAWSGGAPDVLVNNVGRGSSNSFLDAEDADWEHSFQLNLMSHIRTTRFFLPTMARTAVVVNMASDLAKQPESVPVEYGAMKAALLHLTKNLAVTYAPIRVNAVLPGPVWTPLWSGPGGLIDQLSSKSGLDRDAALAQYLEDRQMPLGFADPADVANLVLFLSSDLAKSITGAGIDLGGTIRGLL